MTAPGAGRRPVVVVTGGGGGIGAAAAVELGQRGAHVVTLDPLVSVDGVEQLPDPEETTAGRIVAAGGSAQASNASVTDRTAVADLFAELVAEHGRLDGVINVAGITRPTGVATGTEADWRAVLSVHLDGYRNVLAAALPIMAEAGHGRIVGVTSGSGWRAADAGAYSAAKRAVASLTWQLGRTAPAGVAVNAMSPIAMTRMVTAALARAGAGRPGGSSKTGGLSLGGMPAPEELAPLAAHLVGAELGLQGTILFAGGSEVAVVEPPRLLEVVRTDLAPSVDRVLARVAEALAGAEANQATAGGANPRFAGLFDDHPEDGDDVSTPRVHVRHVLVVSDRPSWSATVAERLRADGVAVATAGGTRGSFEAARAVVDGAAAELGGLDAVVVDLAGRDAAAGDGWEQVLADHDGLDADLVTDAAWLRAAAERTAATERPLRLVAVVDATSPGGRSRAQAVAQLTRAARKATAHRLAAFAVAVEGADEHRAVRAMVHHLTVGEAPDALAGAELAVGPGWLGLRSHPRPATSLVLGGPELPPWFDTVLGEVHP